MKRAFEVKQKTFFLVSQVPSFKHTKQTSKNVADTAFIQGSLMVLRQHSIFFMQSSDIIVIEIVCVAFHINFGFICDTIELIWCPR